MGIYVKGEDSVFDSFKVGRIYIVDNAVTATLKNLLNRYIVCNADLVVFCCDMSTGG